ncbi:MAG: YjhG/YagF family D-xylonate dehydratase [Gemmatimonadetes bacterium]|jgi:xylonate dehydratase|nr:YjhG/YagF family D-xylonate dehydratase [Gemmatimonadota bacterium]MBT5145034.1 YjhG/YagF family D-xylonate dehydratase [Gemmatimonadota bacterium]MBT5592117.1 YjhG/YagF family D-xylonate dehydratase [Gemmatimonadota bacterium]MBT5964174.1 YjhG/YagF family D-xylonate dehydratase [Gemmatimonadota bacterium]MBT7454049.1 YjhG/YagF family D-xylonate dehydratase [Gemmatimonadota bacterium]
MANLDDILHSDDSIYQVHTRVAGPTGALPLTEETVLSSPSGDIFGFSQNAGMGWNPAELGRREFLILSTMGGIRAPDGKPIALGYHTGHWEVGLLMEAAAKEITRLGGIPFAAYCSDPCDGRSQGTSGMFDSLPYRNDAAIVLGRLIRSLPTRRGVLGIGTCDKGLPAILMALAAARKLPVVVVPGGVTLPPESGEDAGKIQSVGSRLAHGEITIHEINDLGCRACASPGGGCQFLGTAATSQVVGEALGLSLPHSALAPSGQPVWTDLAVRSGRALVALEQEGICSNDIVTDAAIHNAMVVHAAFGGSTNLLLHVPAIAYAAGRRRPVVDDWDRINRQTPRLVDVLPNGPEFHPTVRAFLAGGVPEVMLHLREMGLLKLDALTVSGRTVGENLDWWQASERRTRFREGLKVSDGVEADEVIMDPQRAADRGLTSTVCFPKGNLAPEGSVVKSTAIAPSMLDEAGVYRLSGPARIFTTERSLMAAIKADQIRAGDVIVLLSSGPMGSGMEEIAQVTIALKYLDYGKDVALLTDARFSGFSSGPCIGHLGPEALAGGPVGRLVEGDVLEVMVDTRNLQGSINLIGHGGEVFGAERGRAVLEDRPPRDDLAAEAELPDDTRLWAALQNAGGGTWGGCVYDVDAILALLDAGKAAQAETTG